MKLVIKIALGVIAAVLVLGVGCTAVVGGALSETDSGSTAVATDTDKKGQDKGKPATDTVGGFEILGKITPVNDGLGDFGATFRVKNVSDTAAMSWFTVTVLDGEEILTSMDCGDGDDVAPGRTTTVDCISVDDFRTGWDGIEIEHEGF